jgi:flavin reductase (DIM6/NTAB) family NADH-FMN oxidoreductase RutF
MNTAAMDVAHTSCKYRISLLNWFHPAQGGLAQMKQKITVADYAQRITEALPQGVLLNTNGDKHNAMVIGWGGLGTCWSVPTFTVYVRENRYTKSQLDKTGVFTVSIPLDKADPVITKICGWQSGHNIDKVKEAGLTLEEPQANRVSGIKEYPLTLECKVLYSQCQDPTRLPESIYKKSYPQDVDGSYPMANRDPHTAYIGEIVAAYIIH